MVIIIYINGGNDDYPHYIPILLNNYIIQFDEKLFFACNFKENILAFSTGQNSIFTNK